MRNEYELLDSGDGRKLERFGEVVLSRPCAQALWQRSDPGLWATATAAFDRDSGWRTSGPAELPESWIATINDIALRLAPTPAGHVGVFPETRALWDAITGWVPRDEGGPASVLNLFAYTGGATLAAARAGCSVCHVDASKSMVTRARENAVLNQLQDAAIRWIVEDVSKFLDREIRRGRTYETIMLDPPSFGHGVRGEQFKFDRDLTATLERCAALLSELGSVLLTSHTEGVTAGPLGELMGGVLGAGTLDHGEMQLTGASGVRAVNAGVWVRWVGAATAPAEQDD